MASHRQITDSMAGAKNLIEAAGIRPGETILLLADRRSDEVAAEAISAALELHGAHPHLLLTNPVPRYGEVPELVLAALASADVAIWMWPVFLSFSENYRSVHQYRRVDELEADPKPYCVYYEGPPGLLATEYARFPNELLWLIARRVWGLARAGSVVRMEGGHGTRLQARYDPAGLVPIQFSPRQPRGRCHFPYGRCICYRGGEGADGVVYIDCVQGLPGRLDTPLRLEVERGRVVDVSGDGDLVRYCRRMFATVPDSDRVTEVMFGFHPKASVSRGIADAMHWELNGRVGWAGIGTPRDSHHFRHLDGAVMNTRLYIDDRLVVDEQGHLTLLDDPEIRAAARQWGDPDVLLAPASLELHGEG